MSSMTITVSGASSSLNVNFCPEIELNKNFEYSCCLLDLHTYNSIPNVHEKNNKFYYSMDDGRTFDFITLPIGSFEVDDILHLLMGEFEKRQIPIEITASSKTMKCEIKTAVPIDFTKNDSIGSVLGFSKRMLEHGDFTSDKIVNINCVTNLRVDCDLTTGSYHNGKPTHTIHEFNPSVDPGYKISEQPKHLIYLPIVRRRINSLNISIFDQNGELVDFRGETITCRIHIKREPV